MPEKILVIAEKPSVARDIARVMHCNKKTNTYLEGNQYIVTWALGHLVTLADPEEYGKQYQSWSMDTLPMLPKEWKLVVIRQTSRQYAAVKELLHRKDVAQVIIATDAGREGELVARWILDKAGNKKPLRRLWISSVTDKAIREGFSNLKPGKTYENLYHAAVARAQSDWVVGINATRALTCKYNAQLSCGRVQTPTLAMIAAREKEIKKFQPKPYYGLKAVSGGITYTWIDEKSGSGRTFDKNRMEKIRAHSDVGQHLSHAGAGIKIVICNKRPKPLQLRDRFLPYRTRTGLKLQGYRKRGSFSHLTVHRDSASHHIHNVLSDRHAKPGSLYSADRTCFLALKGFKNML